MDQRADSELVEAACSGDRTAFDQLVGRYQSLAQRVAMGMVTNEESARDLAQEAMLQAYLSLRHLKDGSRFQSWLCGIVRNVCRSYLRDRKSDWISLEALTGGVMPEAVWLSDAAPDPHAAAEAHERERAVAGAIEALSPKDRAVARLFYVEQLSLKEVAASVGMSVLGVKNRLYRARKQLRESLGLTYPGITGPLPNPRERRRMIKVVIDRVFEEERLEGRSATVLLRDPEGRTLRISMAAGDAGAIDLGLRNLTLPRPMTFHFMADLLEAAGARLEEVRIESLKEGVLYAVAKLRRGKTVRELDARPSDALALAMRAGSPIYVAEEIMGQAGQDVPDALEQRRELLVDEPSIPDRLPVLPIRDAVFFPRTVFPLFVGRDKSILALEEAQAHDRYVLLLTQKLGSVDDPQAADVYQFGTVGRLMQILQLPDHTVRVMVEGKTRARVLEYLQVEPFHCARVQVLAEEAEVGPEAEALVESVLTRYREMTEQAKTVGLAPPAPANEDLGPGRLADTVAAGIALPVEARQQLLETIDPRERLEKLSRLLT